MTEGAAQGPEWPGEQPQCRETRGVASLQSQPHWHQAGWSSVIPIIHVCSAPARLPLLLHKPGSTLQSREASLLPLCFLPHPLSSGCTGLQGSVDADSLPPPPPPAEVPAGPSAWDALPPASQGWPPSTFRTSSTVPPCLTTCKIKPQISGPQKPELPALARSAPTQQERLNPTWLVPLLVKPAARHRVLS